MKKEDRESYLENDKKLSSFLLPILMEQKMVISPKEPEPYF